MGKLQEFDITFTNNKVVYGPGESMSGTVKIRTGNPLQYKGTSSSSLFSRFSLTAFCAQRSAQLDGNKLFVSVDAKKSRSPGQSSGFWVCPTHFVAVKDSESISAFRLWCSTFAPSSWRGGCCCCAILGHILLFTASYFHVLSNINQSVRGAVSKGQQKGKSF